MSKYTSLILFYIFFPVLLMAGNAPAPKVLKVGVYDNPPKIFTDDNGRPDGIFIDIVESVFAPRKVKVEYVTGK